MNGCSRDRGHPVQAVELTRKHACAVCGMILVDFPGAKGQIHYTNGKYDVFCGTMDMFSYYFQPDTPKNISAIFTNDMGSAQWRTLWIDAKNAYYVYDEKKSGAMGDPFMPFLKEEKAMNFTGLYGGEILSFDNITPDMLKPFQELNPHIKRKK
ncbi:nitrous oxide reductase accessory protein NosL [Candidatus Magnetobacterium casense]|uniref:Nitrous oxide reductase accessory protein NosL n=1 Tax=Candidatus Magnetobacterium casense TaxID=1455061 RepID=A0ABS6RU93_9BACT|nr:nitrous oxide reductase accessory protein NosL [Candidatus Magnetobacterium casensis]MBV6340197.1 nitrous oxide reductase accessory protein NosL [Candidatus Magnetobacterium casensis]